MRFIAQKTEDGAVKRKLSLYCRTLGVSRHNARCESMWARMKTELIYDRCNSEKMTVKGVEVSRLAILSQLLEQPQDLLRQRRPASHNQAAALL